MSTLQPANGLPGELVNRVLNRLDLERPLSPDLETLQQLYAAWCMHVPFDNVRKMIVFASGNDQPFPGLDATDFFENWLTNGSGATCWPVANAFYELLISLGYNATRIAGSMRDMGILNHGSVIVTIDNRDHLAEASLLLNKILPLAGDTIIDNDPVYPLELEADTSSHLLWLKTPPNEEYFSCRLLHEPREFSVFRERYEASRSGSIFNQRLYARRNYPGRLILFWGNTRFTKTMNGIEHLDLTRDELCEALHNDIGISYSLINKWAAAGGLDASFEKPSGPTPPVVSTKPPSQR